MTAIPEIWNNQNRSTLFAEKIKDGLRVETLLPTPGDTSWNYF